MPTGQRMRLTSARKKLTQTKECHLKAVNKLLDVDNNETALISLQGVLLTDRFAPCQVNMNYCIS